MDHISRKVPPLRTFLFLFFVLLLVEIAAVKKKKKGMSLIFSFLVSSFLVFEKKNFMRAFSCTIKQYKTRSQGVRIRA